MVLHISRDSGGDRLDDASEHARCNETGGMGHVDIEVSEGSILIFTDDGEMVEMTVDPSSESVIKVMSSRPPSSVTLHGGDDESDLVQALEALAHEVSAKLPIPSIF